MKGKLGVVGVQFGVRFENISNSFKGVFVLNDVLWEVKRGESVGFVGIYGLGRIIQLIVIEGKEEVDIGNVYKVRVNMRIVFLSQEFEVVGF